MLDVSKTYAIIVRSVLLIQAVTLAVLLGAGVSSRYLAGIGWENFRAHAWFLVIMIVSMEILGGALVYEKLRVWLEFYRLKEAEEPVPGEVTNKSLEMAYGLPASAGLLVFNFALLGSIVMAAALVSGTGGGAIAVLHILTPALVYFAIAAAVAFFVLKSMFRPVILDIAGERPEILIGEFNRTYRFPLGPLLFVRVPVKWRFPIRMKLLASMSMVCLLGTIFLYIGYRQIALSGELSGALKENFSRLFVILILAQVAGSLLLAYLLSSLAARDIGDPISEISRASLSIIGGNHIDRAMVVTEDELGDVAAAVNRMAGELVSGLEDKLESLREMIGSAESGADRLAAVSRGILESVAELSAASAAQRRDAVDAAESAQRLGTTSEEISMAARQIQDLADRALGSCNKGQITVQEMVNTMDRLKNEIHQSSDRVRGLLAEARKIRGVVELIDEISDQINLVSLNAALEAAGAGEAGRRFNAVAEEITRLAQRTLTSTDQVSKMIGGVIGNAETVGELSESGKLAVDQSVASMEEVGVFLVVLLEQVENVSTQVLEISGSTQTQTVDAVGLHGRLEQVESAAVRVDDNIQRIQAALRDMDVIAEQMRGKVSEGLF